MKKILLALIVLTAFAVPAQAGRRQHKITKSAVDIHNKAGVKIDLPHLIGIPQVSKHLFIGLEGGKDVINNIGYGKTYIEDDKGYFVYLKITYNKCLINCGRK